MSTPNTRRQMPINKFATDRAHMLAKASDLRSRKAEEARRIDSVNAALDQIQKIVHAQQRPPKSTGLGDVLRAALAKKRT